MLSGLLDIGGSILVALGVPLLILALGLPIVLVVRLLLELFRAM
jgi:hypothetical protein